jgi:meckelin
VILTGYWFIFFKLQERVYVLLPALNTYSKNYKPYDFLFFIVFGSKALSIIFKIAFEQSSFDVFLIDWERPKLPYSNNSRMGVNAWRSLFLVNELNEL